MNDIEVVDVESKKDIKNNVLDYPVEIFQDPFDFAINEPNLLVKKVKVVENEVEENVEVSIKDLDLNGIGFDNLVQSN